MKKCHSDVFRQSPSHWEPLASLQLTEVQLVLKQEVGEGVSFITRPPSKKGFCRNERLAWREKELNVSWTGITVELQCLFLQGSEKLADRHILSL